MSDEATGKSGKTWRYAAIALAMLPLLYALSVGPAVVLVQRKIVPTASLASIYWPLLWFVDMTGTEIAAIVYLECWLILTFTPHF